MLFGRKRRDARQASNDQDVLDVDEESTQDTSDSVEEAESDSSTDSPLDTDIEESDGDLLDDDADDDSPTYQDEDEDEAEDEGDDAFDEFREDGPFDIDEVDLEADDVARLDFGTLIVTPIEGMELQLQVEEKSQIIQSALIVHEGAGIEIALFAAPKKGGLAAEVLTDVLEATTSAGGVAKTRPGPFGTELLRELTVKAPDGQSMLHRSVLWLVEGPRWMLRAVLMGQAVEEGTPGRELMEDFFRNLVVQRGTHPKAPGDLLPLTIPQNLARQEE